MFHPQPAPFAFSSCFVPDLPPNGFVLGFGIPPARAARRVARSDATAAPRPAATSLRYLYGSSPSTSAASHPQQLTAQHHPQQPHFHIQPPHLRPQQHPYTSAAAAAAMEDQHDMAAQQEAAKDYQPVLEGPLVGDRAPSSKIAREYAKADQVYVEKTVALPRTYSHYRPIQGDGNCGWRAIGFSYFEKLIDSADQAKIEGEVARIMSLNHRLSTVGGYTYFEDWADEMTGLLRELALNLENLDVAHALLLQRWNDASVEGGLIYYLRLLAATYLKANASTYDPFVPDGQNIVSHCSQTIELPNCEIEHLGIVALVNVLLTPADFVLEITYLDRSPGSQVNHHRFTDETGAKEASVAGPIIHLLYRPDHYDILYRTPDDVPPTDVLVQRLSSLSHNVHITGTSSTLVAYSTMEFETLTMIPGLMGVSNMSSLPLPPTTASSIGGNAFSSTQQSPWSPAFTDDAGTPAAQPHSRQASIAVPTHSPTSSGSLGPVSTSLIAGGLGVDAPKRSPLVQTAGGASTTGYPIRFSPVQLDYEESKNAFRESTFQVKTNTFKNSVWNRAHYGNPDFHPEEWSPEEENV